ncbi:MBL fold metallo-hydrolase [Thermoleophilia bacterium SCSIO 60948]|nr:MBL fold metallo-hydrolase [Thermoleophilia bacterium SCSIO 60948]
MSRTREIDLRHLGIDRVIAAHQVGELIIDPGPPNSLDTLLAELEGEPRAILLTHIHLDHAGATGALIERFPAAKVYVHRIGAPHMADPSKLWKSASRIYDDMEGTWGEPVPVPESSIEVLEGGETVEGMRVLHTPGHASHHVTFFDESSGEAFTGDVAGVRVPPIDHVIAPTPPPEVDIEAWNDSLDAVAGLGAERLRLTHFGVAEDAARQIEATRASLARNAEAVRELEHDEFMRWLADDLEAATDAEVGKRLREAVPPEHIWLGLERYWRKRAEREAGDS